MAAHVMLQLAAAGCEPWVEPMVDQEAAREFDRLRAHLGFIAVPEPLRIDGRYQVDRTLGRGAMGVVYLARDERLDRSVALKLVRPRPEMDHERLQLRLEQEARALAKIEHPNIVAVYDVGRYGDETYFTMQYVPGDTLRQWQADASPAAVIGAYLQAARGLAAAHAEGVVHRDFKPDNVLVGERGRVQVADFGIAAALHSGEAPELEDVASGEGGESPSSSRSEGPMTRAGSFVGTVAYASPEQLRGSPADARSDQFALCVSLWEALTEHRPFGGRTRDQLHDSIQGPLPAEEGLPRWLYPILRRGLAFEPGDRFEGMEPLVEAIERGRSGRRRRAVQVVAALGLTTAVAAGWGLSSAAQRAAAPGCDEFLGQIDAVWGAERRQTLVAGAEAEGSAAAEHAASTLDGLAEDWAGSAGALCVDGLAPPTDGEGRQCHEGWLQGLERSVALLTEHGDARTLARAPDLLERLVPPGGNYCALRPSPAVEPEVWSLAEAAREAAIVGDFEGAVERAEAVMSRAEGLGGDVLTAHLAEAHAARAEVLARAGDFAGALQEFPRAERHAIGSGYQRGLWWLRVLWAKVLALGEPGAGERAAEQLRRAEPLAHALGEADSPLLAAELAEARGMVARARGEHREAIAEHQKAYEGFEALGRPLLAARALSGVGASHQLLGQMQAAWDAYEQAEALYERSGVPQGYRNRVRNRLNLGGLAALTERAEQGLSNLEQAVAHGSPDERLEALAVALKLAIAEPSIPADVWAERGLEELREHPGASAQLVHDIELGAGLALARIDRPRGERLMRSAESTARQLPLEIQVLTAQTWIEWLEEDRRCDEMLARLDAVEADFESSVLEAIPGWETWRDARRAGACSTLPHENTNKGL